MPFWESIPMPGEPKVTVWREPKFLIEREALMAASAAREALRAQVRVELMARFGGGLSEDAPLLALGNRGGNAAGAGSRRAAPVHTCAGQRRDRWRAPLTKKTGTLGMPSRGNHSAIPQVMTKSMGGVSSASSL